MEAVELFQVDAFANELFKGNPAAVALLPNAPSNEVWMQNLAMEMNLSETAFVSRREDGDFALRWFTPAAEVDLCGHATLASAHVLWTTDHVPSDAPIRFHTRSGVLTVIRQSTANGDWMTMDFPARPGTRLNPPAGLYEALGLEPEMVIDGSLQTNGMDYLVEVQSESVLLDVAPNFRQLAQLDTRGVIVTATSQDQNLDFKSRFFAPRFDVDEDPVTGSAHCFLGPYWSEKLDKNQLVGFQASARGGVVELDVKGDRIDLRGQAVTVFSGRLLAVG